MSFFQLSGVKIKIQVFDKDDTSDDLVDFLKAMYNSTPASAEFEAEWTKINISERTRCCIVNCIHLIKSAFLYFQLTHQLCPTGYFLLIRSFYLLLSMFTMSLNSSICSFPVHRTWLCYLLWLLLLLLLLNESHYRGVKSEGC